MMASENIQEYLEEYTATDLTNDPVPIKVYKGSINETELFGQSMQWAMEYLNMRECPPKLLESVLTRVRTELNPVNDSAVANNNGSSLLGEKLGFSLNGNPNEPLKLMQSVIQVTDNVLMGLKKSERPGDDSVLAEAMNGLSVNGEVDSNHSASVVHSVSYFSTKNQRRTNEDRIVVYPSLNSVFGVKEPASYFGVFDGHNGAEAAVYGAAQLHHAFIQRMSKASDPKEAIIESFLDIDKMFCEKAKNELIRSGSTVVTAVINGSKLFIAWLGDSQAVLFHDNKINDIVTPHKPEREDERKRIETEGGEVILMNDVYRVNGNLAVSRSLGDADFKNYISGKPDVIEIDLEQINPEYLVLASDGLWDVCSGEDVRTSVDTMILHDEIQESARLLAVEAKSKDSGDNVSIIVVSLQNLKTLKSICRARIGSEAAEISQSEPVEETLTASNGSKEDNPLEILDPMKPNEISADPASADVKLIPAKACKSFPNAVTGGRIDVSTKKPGITANQKSVVPMKSNPVTNKSPTAAKDSGAMNSPLGKSPGLARTSPGTGTKPGVSRILSKGTDAKSPLKKTTSTDVKSPLGRTTTADVKSPLGRIGATTGVTRKLPAPSAKRIDALPQIKSLKPPSKGPLAGDSKPLAGVKSKLVSSVSKAPVTSSSARPMPRKEGNPVVTSAPRPTAGSASRPEMKTTTGKLPLTRPTTSATSRGAATSKPHTAVPASRVGVSAAAATKIATEKPSTATTTSGTTRNAPVVKAGITVASKMTSKVADIKPKSAIVPAPKGTSRSVPLSKDKPTTSMGSKSKPTTLAASRSKTNTAVTNTTTRVNAKKPVNNVNQNLMDLPNANAENPPGPENGASIDLLGTEHEVLPTPETDGTEPRLLVEEKGKAEGLVVCENGTSVDLLGTEHEFVAAPETDAVKPSMLVEEKREDLFVSVNGTSVNLLGTEHEFLAAPETDAAKSSLLVKEKGEAEDLVASGNGTSVDLLGTENEFLAAPEIDAAKSSLLVEEKGEDLFASGNGTSVDLLGTEHEFLAAPETDAAKSSLLVEEKGEAKDLFVSGNGTSVDLLGTEHEYLAALETDTAKPSLLVEEKGEDLFVSENGTSVDLLGTENEFLAAPETDAAKSSLLVEEKGEGPVVSENVTSVDLLGTENEFLAAPETDAAKSSLLVEEKGEGLVVSENVTSVDLLGTEHEFLAAPEIEATMERPFVEKKEEGGSV